MYACHAVAGLKFLSCKSDVEKKMVQVVVIEKELVIATVNKIYVPVFLQTQGIR